MSRILPDDLRRAGLAVKNGHLVKIPNHQSAYEKTKAVVAGLPVALLKPDARKALVGPAPDEKGSSARVVLRLTRHARHTLDFDNGAGGCKPLGDQLRYAGLIRDDSPEYIDFQFRQVKVRTKAEEGMLIEIEEIKP